MADTDDKKNYISYADALKGVRLTDLYPEKESPTNFSLPNIPRSAADMPELVAGFGYTNIPQNPDYGTSRYDITLPTLSEYLNYQNIRGERQPAYLQLLNGVLKGAITAGTTMVNTLAGLPVGVMEAVANGNISKIWDNEITNFMDNISTAAERFLPNYYTDEELNSPWYTNIFTANFLGDTIIKNFGFAVGASAAGLAISKIPKLLPKLLTTTATKLGRAEQDVAAIGRAANAFSTGFLSAVGEGSLEALQATKETSKALTDAINQEYNDNMYYLQQKYANIAEDLSQRYSPEEVQSIMNSLQGDYQNELYALENTKEQKMAQVAAQRAQIGNAVLGFNIPILTIGNLLTLGKVFAKGYTAEMSSIGSHIKFHPEDLGRAGQTINETSKRLTLRGIKEVEKPVTKQAFTGDITRGKNIGKIALSSFWEGNEEMLQAWASNASKLYNYDYFQQSVNPEYTDKTANMWKSLGDAFVETFGNIDNWEEFAIGMVSGGMSNLVLGQGRAMREKRKAVETAVNQLNDAVNTFNNREMIKGINRHQYLEDLKTRAAIEHREKEFKDADFAQLASDVVLFGSLGKLDELKAVVDYNLDNLSDEELDQLGQDLSQQGAGGPENNHFTKLDTKGKRRYLKDQQNKYHQVIDDYNNEYNELTALTGNYFSQEALSELVYERLRAKNSSSRAEEVMQNFTSLLDQALQRERDTRNDNSTQLEVHKNILNFTRRQLTSWNNELLNLKKEARTLKQIIKRNTSKKGVQVRELTKRDLDNAELSLISRLYVQDENKRLSAETLPKSTRKHKRANRLVEISEQRISQLEKQIDKLQKLLNEYEKETTASQKRKEAITDVEIPNAQNNIIELRDNTHRTQAQIKFLSKAIGLSNVNIEGYTSSLQFIKDNLGSIFSVSSKSLMADKVNETAQGLQLLTILLSPINTDTNTIENIGNTLTDIVTLMADAKLYNDRVAYYAEHPRKLEEKNQGIRERALNRIQKKKIDRIAEQLRNTATYEQFDKIVQNLGPDIKNKVLELLKNENNRLALEYENKRNLEQRVTETVNQYQTDQLTKSQVLLIFKKALNILPYKEVFNTDNQIYSKENNLDILKDSPDNYENVLQVLSVALYNAKNEEQSSATTQDPINTDTEKPSEAPESQNEEDELEDLLNTINSSTIEDPDKTVDNTDPESVARNGVVEDTEEEIIPEGTTFDNDDLVDLEGVTFPEDDDSGLPEGITVLDSEDSYIEDPTDANGVEDYTFDESLHPNNERTEELSKTGKTEQIVNKVSSTDGIEKDANKPTLEQPREGSLTMSIREFDKEGMPAYENPNLPEGYRAGMRILYDYLKDRLKAFENVDNGLIHKGDTITFGVDPQLDETITNGATNGYKAFTVLMFVEDDNGQKHCVGSIADDREHKYKPIIDKVRQEYEARAVKDSKAIFYSSVTARVSGLWAGIVKYENSYRPATMKDLKPFLDRMDESVPPILIAENYENGTTAFRQGTHHNGIVLNTGQYQSISSMYNGIFYDGTAVLMLPTGAYNRDEAWDNQSSPKALIPVGIKRLKAKNLRRNTDTYHNIKAAIESLFKDNITRQDLKVTVARLRQLLVMDYFKGKDDTQEVHIEVAVPKHDEQGNIISNQYVEINEKNPYWNNHDINNAQVPAIMIRIKRKDGSKRFYVKLHNGSIANTTPLSEEEKLANTEQILDLLSNEDTVGAFVNINRASLLDPLYIEKIVKDGLVLINTDQETGTRVVSNSFSFELNTSEKSYKTTTGQQVTEQPKENTEDTSNTNITNEDISNENITQESEPAYYQRHDAQISYDEEELERSTSLVSNSEYEKIDIEHEVNEICRMLPQLNKEQAFRIVDDLITFIDKEGKEHKAFGTYKKALITLSNIAERGTGYHEAYHLIFNALLTNNERKALYEEYRKLYNNDSLVELEERMAEDFREYCLMQEAPKSLSQKIVNWFRRLFNTVFGYNRHTPIFNRVIRNAYQGRYASREVNTSSNIKSKENNDIRYSIVPELVMRSNGPSYKTNRGEFWVGDLSVERFQRLVDSQVNNRTFTAKSGNKDNAWGLLRDSWKSIGVDIQAVKRRNKYIVTNIDVNNAEVQYQYDKYIKNLNKKVDPNDPFDINSRCYV